MLAFLVRRLFFAAVALLAVMVIDYAMFGNLWHQLDRAFLHFDFGRACSQPGCPPVRKLWARSWPADVYLLAGSLFLGVAGGLAGAVFCATRPRSIATRTVETLGMLFYSIPAYLFGFGVLLLFEPSFGAFPLPVFFHPLDYEAPFADPWKFTEAMVVPWIVLAAPFAAVVMRLMQAAILDEVDADYVRTARAKGLGRRRVIRRHAARARLRRGGVAGRRVGAELRDEHGARRVRVLRPRLLRPDETRARSDPRAAARLRHPDGSGPRAVGGGADRGGERAGRRGAGHARPARGASGRLSARRRDGDPRRALAPAQRDRSVECPARGLLAAGGVDGVAAREQPLDRAAWRAR